MTHSCGHQREAAAPPSRSPHVPIRRPDAPLHVPIRHRPTTPPWHPPAPRVPPLARRGTALPPPPPLSHRATPPPATTVHPQRQPRAPPPPTAAPAATAPTVGPPPYPAAALICRPAPSASPLSRCDCRTTRPLGPRVHRTPPRAVPAMPPYPPPWPRNPHPISVKSVTNINHSSTPPTMLTFQRHFVTVIWC